MNAICDAVLLPLTENFLLVRLLRPVRQVPFSKFDRVTDYSDRMFTVFISPFMLIRQMTGLH